MLCDLLVVVGVTGGVTASRGLRCVASDCFTKGSLAEGDRDGGALRTTGLETEVVAFRSRQCLDIDGQCRPKRVVTISPDALSDLRRSVEVTAAKPSSLIMSLPGVHSEPAAGRKAD